MTTIAWDGKVLASDRIATHTSSSLAYCTSCDAESKRRHTRVRKITIDKNPPPHLFGDGALFMGYSGHVETCRILYSLLSTGATEKTIKEVMSQSVVLRDVGFIVISGGKGYSLTYHDSKFEYKEIEPPFATGSGIAAATFAMKSLGMDAVSAVAAAIDSDDYSGGGISFVRLDSPNPIIERVDYVPGTLSVTAKYKTVMPKPEPKPKPERKPRTKGVKK